MNKPLRSLFIATWLLGMALLFPSALWAQARILISQYYEGASNNKWIEVANTGNAAYDPAATPLYLCLVANPKLEADLTGKLTAQTALPAIPAGGVVVFKNSSAALPAYALATAANSGACNFNGDDIVYLSTANTATTAWAARTDVLGAIKGDGTANLFGADKAFVRKTDTPTTTWDAANWEEVAYSAVDVATAGTNAYLGYHSSTGGSPDPDPAPKPSVFYQEEMDDCHAQGRGWQLFDAASNLGWSCTSYGKDNTQAIQANNYGADADAEDWLISPAIAPQAIKDCELVFWMRTKFAGPDLQVLYSKNHQAGNAPAQATWTPLQAQLPAPNSDTWTEVRLPLSSLEGPLHIAFKYTGGSASGTSQRITLDAFGLQGSAGAALSFSPKALSVTEVGKAVSYTIEGQGLDKPLQLQASSGWEISLDGSSWNAVATVPTLPQQVQVRLAQDPGLSTSGSLLHQSEGLATALPLSLNYTAPPKPRDNTFDIVSWNLEWFGTPDKSKNATSFAQQLDAVSSKLLELNADVYALQEVTQTPTENYLQQLVDKLNALTAPGTFSGVHGPRYSYYWEAFDPTFPPQKVAYIYRNATVSVKGQRSFFSESYTGVSSTYPAGYPTGTPSSFWASGRLPFELTVDASIQGSTQRLHLVNLHAKAMSDSKERRAFDGTVLFDSLKTAQYDRKNLIVLGDFNDYLTGSTGGGASPYANWISSGNVYFQAAATQDRSIDHVLISNELYDEFEASGRQMAIGSTSISDHDPLLVSLILGKDQDDTVTGLEDLKAAGVKLFPNPAQTHATLQWDASLGEQAQVRVLDASGRLRWKGRLQQGESLQTEGWAPGLYLLQLQWGKRVVTARLVVQ